MIQPKDSSVKTILLIILMYLVPSLMWAENEAWVGYDASTKMLAFHYDENKSSAQGIVTYSLNNDDESPAWLEQQANIESVVIEESFSQVRPTTCYRWFFHCTKLTSITGLENLNTSEVTDMRQMFYECSSLPTLDLSSLDTRKVKTMNSMFTNDAKLASISFSNQFAGTNLEEAKELFAGCTSLTKLDLRYLVTTDKLTSTKQMFTQCSSLEYLDISGMNTSSVTDMSYMFAGCTALKGVLAGYYFIVDNVTDDTNMFYSCTSLPGFDESSIGKAKANYDNDGYFTDMAYVLYNAASKTLSFYGKEKFAAEESTDEMMQLNTGDNAPAWFKYNQDIVKIVIDESFANARPTSCYYWFYKLTNITSIEGLEYLNTSEVTTMSHMFEASSTLKELKFSNRFKGTKLEDARNAFKGCSSLREIDLSGLQTTDKLTHIENMFQDCDSLRSVDISGMNTTGVKSATEMFQHCSVLRVIHTGDSFTLDVQSQGEKMFDGCGFLPGFEESSVGKEKAKHFPDGYFYGDNPVAWVQYEVSERFLRFHYDNNWNTNFTDTIYRLNTGTETPQWAHLKDKIEWVTFYKFSNARPTSCYQWFKGFKRMNLLYSSHLNANEVTTMQEMFYDCQTMRDIEFSSYTTKLTTTNSMFRNCKSLTSIDVQLYDAYELTDMGSMFRDCPLLKEIRILYDTKKLTDISYAFCNDSALEKASFFEYFNGECIQNATAVFKNCKSVKLIDMRFFKTSEALKTTEQMFDSCCSLQRIYIPKMNTSGVNNMSNMFRNDSSLRTIYVGDDFIVPDSAQYDGLFEGCISLPCFDKNADDKEKAKYFPEGYLYEGAAVPWVSYSKTDKTLTFHYNEDSYMNLTDKIYPLNTGLNPPVWSEYKDDITKVVFERNFANTCPTSCYQWFANFKNLTTIEGANYLNTSSVTSMAQMFTGCKSLTSLDLSTFDTKNVQSMANMFDDCQNLTELNVSGLDVQSLQEAQSMFKGCSRLKNLTLDWKNATSLTSAGDMFNGCKSLNMLDLTSFSTANVKSTSGMFENCDSLVAIYTSDSFALSSDCSSANMFNASPLLPAYDATKVDKSKACYYSKGGYFFSKANTKPWVDVYTKLVEEGQSEKHNMIITFHYDDAKDLYLDSTGYNHAVYDMPSENLVTPEWVTYIQKLNERNVYHITAKFNPSFSLYRPTTCYKWFYNIHYLWDGFQGLEYLNTSDVTNMDYMFYDTNFPSIDLSHFNTENVTSMAYMFYGQHLCHTLDLRSFNTSKVTDMTGMFSGCTSLDSIYLSSFNTSEVTSMAHMFERVCHLTSLDLTSFDISKVTDMSYMFNHEASGNYRGCNLTNIYVNEDFVLGQNCSADKMFVEATTLPHYDGTADKTKAHYKEGGYLTLRRQFSVGDTKYNADGWGDETTCYDDVDFTADPEYRSAFDFSFSADNTASYTRTTSNHWATLCLPFAFSADNSTARFYSVKSYTEGNIAVTALTGTIEAGTPVLAYITNGELNVNATGAAAVAEAKQLSELKGVFAQTEVADEEYIIANDHFWNASWLKTNNEAVKNVYVAPYRASLTLNLTAGAKPYSISINLGETDGIDSIDTTDPSAFLDGAELYDLQGRRLSAPQRGVMIVRKGGVSRKVIIK